MSRARVGVGRGPGALGTEPRAQLRRARRAHVALRLGPGQERARVALPAGPLHDRLRRDARRRPSSTPSSSRRRSRPTSTSRASALAARKHVLVEKPPAMRGEEMDELVQLARRSATSCSCPATCSSTTRASSALKEMIDGRRARAGALRLREPPEPRDHPLERERALVARRPRPLRDPAPARRGAGDGARARARLPHRRRRGRRLLLPALPVREDRAHAPVLARPAQDAEDHRRRHREDGRVRRHGARAEGDRVREGAVAAVRPLRRVADAHRRHLQPADRARTSRSSSSAGSSCASSAATATGGRSAEDGARVVRALDLLTNSLDGG